MVTHLDSVGAKNVLLWLSVADVPLSQQAESLNYPVVESLTSVLGVSELTEK